MKTALILGITGTFGQHVAKALLAKGYQLRALARDANRVTTMFPNVECIVGDVSDIDTLRSAATGVDTMVYGISPANYDWKDKAYPWLDNAARVAEELKLSVLFPGNVYVYDPNDGANFTEESRHHPISSKGEIRLAMEQRLARAAQNGAQVIIVRAGDFIAANSKSSWMPFLVKKDKENYVVTSPGPANQKHCWAYLPDAANAAAELVERRQTLSSFNEFHFPGYQYTMEELANAIKTSTGRAVKIKSFPWWAIKISAPFSKLSKGMLEMRYLWDRQVNLNETKIKSTLGKQFHHTPIEQALVEAKLI